MPECAGALELHAIERDGVEIMEGHLLCREGAHRFPICAASAIRNLDQVASDKAATAEKFGWQ